VVRWVFYSVHGRVPTPVCCMVGFPSVCYVLCVPSMCYVLCVMYGRVPSVCYVLGILFCAW